MGKLRLVTNSEMTCARRCAREHHYAYDLGIRPIEDAEALRFGSLIHAGLEQLWLGNGLEAALVAGQRGAIDEFEAAKVRVLLTGYDARWGDEHHDQVVAVERQFCAPLINPETGAPSRTYELGGKLDVLLRRRFVEHKTTSEDIGLGSTYWRRLTINSQVSTYYAGAKSLGHEVDGCIYDVIRKPGIRPAQVTILDESGFKIVLDKDGERVFCKNGKKGVGPKPRETGSTDDGYVLQTRPETANEYAVRLAEDVAANPDRYYQRGEVVRLEAEELEAAQDAWQLTRIMRENEVAKRWPRNPDACIRHSRPCPYFDVCCGTASLEDTSRFVRVDNVHQELDLEAAQ